MYIKKTIPTIIPTPPSLLDIGPPLLDKYTSMVGICLYNVPIRKLCEGNKYLNHKTSNNCCFEFACCYCCSWKLKQLIIFIGHSTTSTLTMVTMPYIKETPNFELLYPISVTISLRP